MRDYELRQPLARAFYAHWSAAAVIAHEIPARQIGEPQCQRRRIGAAPTLTRRRDDCRSCDGEQNGDRPHFLDYRAAAGVVCAPCAARAPATTRAPIATVSAG